MFVVRRVHPCEVTVNRLAKLRTWAVQTIRSSKVGLAAGLALAALTGAPSPLPQLALLGPLVATCAMGKTGGRIAAGVGFVSYLAFGRPEPIAMLVAAAIAALLGWGVPRLVERSLEEPVRNEESNRGASAVVIDCEGFASLDETYGSGASHHVFTLLQRALKMETREGDLVVHSHGQELVLVLDGSNPAIAQAVMERVEHRFAGWLADAGYECNLSVGLSNGDEGDAEIEAMMRSARYPNGDPYLD